MNRSKKQAPAPRPRWPKGHPQAGKFAARDLYAEYQKELKARQRAENARAAKDRKNAALREKRQKIRDARSGLAVHDQRVREEYSGWGNASTSRIREGKTYKFHGTYKVTATGDNIGKLLDLIGSSARRPRALGDGNYEVIVTPQLGHFTADQFFGHYAKDDPGKTTDVWVAGLGESYTGGVSQFEGLTSKVEFLGSFWRDPETGK